MWGDRLVVRHVGREASGPRGTETPCVVRERPALRMALGSPWVVREVSDLYGTETPCVVRGQRSVWHWDHHVW